MAVPARMWMVRVVVGVVLGAVVLFSLTAYAMRSHDFRYAGGAKQLGQALNLYAYEGGAYPLLGDRPGKLIFDTTVLEADYLPEVLSMMISPADPARDEAASKSRAYFIDQCSYMYLGYAVWDDDSVQAFAEAYKKHRAEGGAFDADLPVDRPYQSIKRIVHVKEGNAQSEAAEHAVSEIPLLIERPRLYPGPWGLWLLGPVVPISRSVMGGNVVYQDGHAEFLEYPGKWPMTKRTIETLLALEG